MLRISIEADCSVLDAKDAEDINVYRALDSAGIAVDNLWVEVLDEEYLGD